MADQNLYQWIATGFLGVVMGLSRWIGVREVKRLDKTRESLHQLERETVTWTELNGTLNRIDTKLDSIAKEIHDHYEKHHTK